MQTHAGNGHQLHSGILVRGIRDMVTSNSVTVTVFVTHDLDLLTSGSMHDEQLL